MAASFAPGVERVPRRQKWHSAEHDGRRTRTVTVRGNCVNHVQRARAGQGRAPALGGSRKQVVGPGLSGGSRGVPSGSSADCADRADRRQYKVRDPFRGSLFAPRPHPRRKRERMRHAMGPRGRSMAAAQTAVCAALDGRQGPARPGKARTGAWGPRGGPRETQRGGGAGRRSQMRCCRHSRVGAA